MLADERAALGKSFRRAVDDDGVVGKFAPAFGGIGEERACAAFDIDPAVGFRGARIVGEFVELILARHDRFAQRFQHLGALMEGHRAQRRAADIARVCQNACEIAHGRADFRDGFAGHGGSNRL